MIQINLINGRKEKKWEGSKNISEEERKTDRKRKQRNSIRNKLKIPNS